MDGRFISYLRVSTDKQGRSGLGLDAQRKIVTEFLNGGDWTLVAEFVEVESGKANSRKELADALCHAQRTGATLLIAKLDRLSRNLAFIANLMESGVPFVACDMPHARPFELHIRASLAEEEARLISQRTKDALKAARIRGKVLGGYRGGPVPNPSLSVKARQAASAAFTAMVGPMVLEMRRNGASLRRIADKLIADGVRTPRGGQWTPTAVKNILDRLS